MRRSTDIRASTAVRALFGTACIATLCIAVLVGGDPRWYAISGALGLIWWAWDLLLEHVILPVGDWLFAMFTGGPEDPRASQDRLTLDDTIRLLESHLARPTSRKVDINSAIRLEEIYRTVKQNPERARRVIETVLERYPDARELERYREGSEGTVGDGKRR